MVVQNCHHFHMSFMVHCGFENGSQNQHFQSRPTVFSREWGRGCVTKKSTLSTLSIMLAILDDP